MSKIKGIFQKGYESIPNWWYDDDFEAFSNWIEEITEEINVLVEKADKWDRDQNFDIVEEIRRLRAGEHSFVDPRMGIWFSVEAMEKFIKYTDQIKAKREHVWQNVMFNWITNTNVMIREVWKKLYNLLDIPKNVHKYRRGERPPIEEVIKDE